MDGKEIVQILDLKRIEKDIKTRKELCQKAGITETAMCHWGRGRTTPNIKVLKRVCDYLGMSQEERGQLLM